MKFDVTLKREKGGITQAEVPWATGLEKGEVVDAVGSMLFHMERDPEQFSGNIIISQVVEAQILNFPKCADDPYGHTGSQAQTTRRDG